MLVQASQANWLPGQTSSTDGGDLVSCANRTSLDQLPPPKSVAR